MKRNMLLTLAAVLVGTGLGPLAPMAQAQRARGATPLDAAARDALVYALAGPEGEYAARAEYTAILEAFGAETQPYANILLAEQKHVAALERQCAKFGVPIPSDPYLGNIEAPASLIEAAEAGVAAEVKNAALYEVLLASVQRYPSLVQVFTHLRDASLNNHLPAFEAAVESGGTRPTGGTQCGGQTAGATDQLRRRAQDGSCQAE